MARCLIIGCGCRGLLLAAELRARGHVVRGTTRHADRAGSIEQAGTEAFVGDPDRVATLAPALEQVGVSYVLLGSATGSDAALAALHGPRLDMLLARMLDSTVRGIVYEASGTVDSDVLARGSERVREFCEDSRVPYVLLTVSGSEYPAWVDAAAGAGERVLAGFGAR